jgi:hypothetical protein
MKNFSADFFETTCLLIHACPWGNKTNVDFGKIDIQCSWNYIPCTKRMKGKEMRF